MISSQSIQKEIVSTDKVDTLDTQKQLTEPISEEQKLEEIIVKAEQEEEEVEEEEDEEEVAEQQEQEEQINQEEKQQEQEMMIKDNPHHSINAEYISNLTYPFNDKQALHQTYNKSGGKNIHYLNENIINERDSIQYNILNRNNQQIAQNSSNESNEDKYTNMPIFLEGSQHADRIMRDYINRISTKSVLQLIDPTIEASARWSLHLQQQNYSYPVQNGLLQNMIQPYMDPMQFQGIQFNQNKSLGEEQNKSLDQQHSNKKHKSSKSQSQMEMQNDRSRHIDRIEEEQQAVLQSHKELQKENQFSQEEGSCEKENQENQINQHINIIQNTNHIDNLTEEEEQCNNNTKIINSQDHQNSQQQRSFKNDEHSSLRKQNIENMNQLDQDKENAMQNNITQQAIQSNNDHIAKESKNSSFIDEDQIIGQDEKTDQNLKEGEDLKQGEDQRVFQDSIVDQDQNKAQNQKEGQVQTREQDLQDKEDSKSIVAIDIDDDEEDNNNKNVNDNDNNNMNNKGRSVSNGEIEIERKKKRNEQHSQSEQCSEIVEIGNIEYEKCVSKSGNKNSKINEKKVRKMKQQQDKFMNERYNITQDLIQHQSISQAHQAFLLSQNPYLSPHLQINPYLNAPLRSNPLDYYSFNGYPPPHSLLQDHSQMQQHHHHHHPQQNNIPWNQYDMQQGGAHQSGIGMPFFPPFPQSLQNPLFMQPPFNQPNQSRDFSIDYNNLYQHNPNFSTNHQTSHHKDEEKHLKKQRKRESKSNKSAGKISGSGGQNEIGRIGTTSVENNDGRVDSFSNNGNAGNAVQISLQNKSKRQKSNPKRNTIKNLGNQIISFINLKETEAKIVRIAGEEFMNKEYNQFIEYCNTFKNRMLKIGDLRFLWEDHNNKGNYHKLIRILSRIYLKDYSVPKILTSNKLRDRPIHLHIRRILLNKLYSPQSFFSLSE